MFTHESRGRFRTPPFIVLVLIPMMWIASASDLSGLPDRASLPIARTKIFPLVGS